MPVKDPWYKKYLNIKGRAKERGLVFSLSFEDYKDLAAQAGITEPSQIGRISGKYQMARIGDIGGYELGNCRFVLKEQNDKEALENGCYEHISGLRKGKTKTEDSGRLTTSIKLSFKYELVSPIGEVFTGENLKEFCKLNGLDQGHMSKVCNGKLKQHKGWTGKYIKESK